MNGITNLVRILVIVVTQLLLQTIILPLVFWAQSLILVLKIDFILFYLHVCIWVCVFMPYVNRWTGSYMWTYVKMVVWSWSYRSDVGVGAETWLLQSGEFELFLWHTPSIFSLHAISYRFWLFLRTPLTSLQACWLPFLPAVSPHGEAPLEMVSPPDSHLSKPGECSTHYFKPFLLFLLTWCMVDSLFSHAFSEWLLPWVYWTTALCSNTRSFEQ